jgi:hypothetical protein
VGTVLPTAYVCFATGECLAWADTASKGRSAACSGLVDRTGHRWQHWKLSCLYMCVCNSINRVCNACHSRAPCQRCADQRTLAIHRNGALVSDSLTVSETLCQACLSEARPLVAAIL